MDIKYSKEPAIIVDWEHVVAFPKYAAFVADKQRFLEVILLVPSPYDSPYPPDNSHDTSSSTSHTGTVEPTVVLRNNGDLPSLAFKASAISLVQDMSNLVPVAAWDDDPEVSGMYRAAGVPFTTELTWDGNE